MAPDNQSIYDFYFDRLKFCGCGNPADALEFLRDVLQAIRHKFSGDRSESMEQFRERCKREQELLPLDSKLALSYRYWLDAKGFTEHGGSVYGMWLTEEGERVLALLESSKDLDDAMLAPWEREEKKA